MCGDIRLVLLNCFYRAIVVLPSLSDSDPSYYLVDILCSVSCCCQSNPPYYVILSDQSSHHTTHCLGRFNIWTVLSCFACVMATKRPAPDYFKKRSREGISACCKAITMFISNNLRLLMHLILDPQKEFSQASDSDQATCSTCKLHT